MKNKKSNNRSFGILFFIVFLILGLYPTLKGNSPNIYLISISIPFIILGIINSKILTPLSNAWIKLGEILGIIIAPIVMAIIYFFILTPISLIVRIFGKDLLSIKFDKQVNTYWINRKKNINSMKKQF
jgi:hypothetical protein|tara:strand:+ start:1303 stop:1686 length:384 start_codon:yes stop_codon:yes gene_type:complete